MRYCVSSSSNGKMSEYHAAVGLAELSNWTDKVNLYHGAIRTYRQTARKFGFADRLVTYPRTDLIYPLLMCENERESLRVRSSLTDHLIGYRLWYGEGMQVHPYFRDRLSDDLDVTSSLTRRTHWAADGPRPHERGHPPSMCGNREQLAEIRGEARLPQSQEASCESGQGTRRAGHWRYELTLRVPRMRPGADDGGGPPHLGTASSVPETRVDRM